MTLRLRILLTIFVLAAIFGGMWYAGPPRFRNIVLNGLEDRTLKLRVKYWTSAVWMILDSPIIGHGFGAYRNQVYGVQARINELKGGTWFDDYPEPKPRRPHSEPLEALVDMGVIGFVITLGLLIVILRHGWSVYTRGNEEERLMAASCLAAYAALIVNGLFFFPLRVNTTLFMAVLTAGIMEGLYGRQQKAS